MTIAHFGIGELGKNDTNWEGSIPHMLLHGGAGCVAMLAMDGNCSSGFFAGASQSILAGSSLSYEQKIAMAPLVGAFSGFLGADGKPVSVTFGSEISQSGLANNYLTHEEAHVLALAEREVANCQLNPSSCSPTRVAELNSRIQELKNLDMSRDQLLVLACRGGIQSVGCSTALADARAAANSYFEAAQEFLSIEDYIEYIGGEDIYKAMHGEFSDLHVVVPAIEQSTGPLPWLPEYFGAGLALGVFTGIQGAAGVGLVSEAVRMCAGNVTCIGAIVGQVVGAEVLAEFAGGYFTIRAVDGKILSQGAINQAQGALGEDRVFKYLLEQGVTDITRQTSYLNGKIVPYGTRGSVRPDLTVCGEISCEVKSYDLSASYSRLVRNISTQAIKRSNHLPEGMVQNIYIDITGQSVSREMRFDIQDEIVRRTNGVVSAGNITFVDAGG